MSFLSNILDPIFGSDTTQEDAEAQRLIDEATAAYSGVKAPNQSPIKYDDFKYAGDVVAPTVKTSTIIPGDAVEFGDTDARLAALDLVDGSAFEGISVDPRLKDAQYGSLGALDDIAKGGGMTAADEANLARVQNQAAQADRGRREAILQNMQARGMGGGGMELLAQLQSSQAATDRQAQEGLDIAGMAQQRALDAIMRSGELAGSMRGQQFGEDAQIAAAKDAIAQFNAGLTQDNRQFNAGQLTGNDQFQTMGKYQAGVGNRDYTTDVGKFNANATMDMDKFRAGQQFAAGMRNADTKQGVSNATITQGNKATDVNYQAPQQRFENELAKAGGIQTGKLAGSGYQQGLGARKVAKDAAYMDAAIKGGTAAAGYYANKKPGA